ncbi:zinc finger protein 629-like [Epinephelus fuscoguttatus]|uniref:zinc finger protein 629-like n=1 Tax=Epinephelus fuscoguttatus TaxID=293821 RepID=UPI0020D0B679|nr:zinc finger protein 629-like [Epinephelus fuscoguttatus]
MSKVQMLRSLVKQRLTAAAEEIFGLFERTIAEYEEELCRSKEENERQRKLLDAVFNPQLQLNEGDVQQLLVVKEKVPPEQQEWSSSVDQEDPEPPHTKEDQEDPEPPHIKEEQEELWISQEGEQLQGLEEDDITKFPFTPVPVKSEDDEEKPQSSQLHQGHTEQMEIEVEVEDWGGPEPDTHLQLESDDKTGKSSEPETDDSDDWTETREPQSGLNSLKNDQVPVNELNGGKKPFRCSECGKYFSLWQHLRKHIRTHSEEKRFSCSVCKKSFTRSGNLHKHMRTHTGEKPYSCSVCKKSFTESGNLYKHMRTHSGEKPHSCSVCKKSFTSRGHLQTHMMVHTGEKPFSCSVCNQRFIWLHQLRNHQCVSRQSPQPH